jgi:hypothetical protein
MHLPKSLFVYALLVLITASFKPEGEVAVESSEEISRTDRRTEIVQLWEHSGLEQTDISLKAFQYGLTGYRNLKAMDPNLGSHLAIIDFSQPSDRERLVIYNVDLNQVAFTSLVAHGRNSGENMATAFSNTVRSFQSSLGFYHTAETYQGQHGYSMRLDGLEAGFNDRARERAVVMHGADYATRDFIERNGRLGRSYGCPSLPPELSAEIIDYLKEDHVIFIYADDAAYLSSSKILNS